MLANRVFRLCQFWCACACVRVCVCWGGISIFIQTDQNKSIMVLSQFKDFGSIHSRQSIKKWIICNSVITSSHCRSVHRPQMSCPTPYFWIVSNCIRFCSPACCWSRLLIQSGSPAAFWLTDSQRKKQWHVYGSQWVRWVSNEEEEVIQNTLALDWWFTLMRLRWLIA